MTASEAKKDVKARLERHGVAFDKLTAKTVSFQGFGYGCTVFVKVHGAKIPRNIQSMQEVFNDIPKPSDGGYCVEYEGTVRL